MSASPPDRPAPLVSVVMPCFNGASYVAEAIASVRAQTFEDWELLVVDNNSSDRSPLIAGEFAAQDARIRVLACPTPGAGRARNLGIREARGRYIAFLDCDDLWMPGKLAAQVEAMQRHDAALCWGSYEVIQADGQVQRVQTASATTTYDDFMAKRNVFGCLTVMLDTARLGKQYMPDLRMRQDYALWARLIRQAEAERLALVGLPQVLGQYRVHPEALTRNKFKAAYYQWRLYRDAEQLGLVRSLRFFGHYLVNALADRR